MKKAKTYTITQAAKKLGISRQAVHEAINKKQLKGAEKVEVAREIWVIPEAALKAYRVSLSHKQRGKKSDIA